MPEYIERAALFKFADAIEQDFLARNERPVFDLEGLRYLAQQLPSADVAPVVHGRWSRVDYKPLGHDYFCSLCNYSAANCHNYCPNCGARMDGE